MCDVKDKEKCYSNFETAMKLVVDGYSNADAKIIADINRILDVFEKQTKLVGDLIVKINAVEEENAKLWYQIDELKRKRR